MLLYLLSYPGMNTLVPEVGLEPTTRRLVVEVTLFYGTFNLLCSLEI